MGVLNVAGGSRIEVSRLSPLFRPAVGTSLASRTPSLLNGPGVASLDGVAVGGQRFDENMPLRDGVPLVVRLADGTERVIQSPVINTVAGAMPIQEVFEHTEWVSQSGNPVAYAPHLRKSPLAGVAAKSVIYQFAKGDQIVPNPATTALLRAGDLADRATFYRHDLAFAENPLLPTNPHGFLTTTRHPRFSGDHPGRPGADRDVLRHGRRDGHPPRAGALLRGADQPAAAGEPQLHPAPGPARSSSADSEQPKRGGHSGGGFAVGSVRAADTAIPGRCPCGPRICCNGCGGSWVRLVDTEETGADR